MEQLEKGYDLSKSEEISIRETIEKFSCRYQEDDELQAICDEFMEYLENRNHNLMERITKDLEELVYIRRLEILIAELKFKGINQDIVNFT
ncbi:MAG TPA: hypothetical protein EYP86_04690 [Candidatus Altiarchaeales archaeon]|nr:hypothetical protein [Candidatus Altiarchaeales archaeon]